MPIPTNTALLVKRATGVIMMCAAIIGSLSTSIWAQYLPPFGPPSEGNSSLVVSGSTSSASVPVGTGGMRAMTTFALVDDLGFSLSETDGKTYDASVDLTKTYGMPALQCGADVPSLCGASVAVLNGNIYIAFGTYRNCNLAVVKGTPITGSLNYNWTYVHNDASVVLTTAPAMVAYKNHLLLVFGSSSYANNPNALYSVTYDDTAGSQGWSGTSITYQSGSPAKAAASAARPGLAVIGNDIYLATQQFSSSHALVVYRSPDIFTWTPIANLPNQQIGDDLQMVSNKGYLVAATRTNTGNSLFLLSSADGINWSSIGNSAVQLLQGPGLTVYNGAFSLSFKNKSDQTLNGAAAPSN